MSTSTFLNSRFPPAHTTSYVSVQDYFGRGLSGIFRGKDLEVPTQGWGLPRPIGDFDRELPATLPRFGVFVLTWRTRPWTDRRRLSSLRAGPVGDLLAQACTQSPSRHSDATTLAKPPSVDPPRVDHGKSINIISMPSVL